MNAYDAATALQNELQHFHWLNAVAVGESDGRPAIYIYVKSLNHRELEPYRRGYRGFPVLIEKMGTAWPATTA